jgi:hypothetical protein
MAIFVFLSLASVANKNVYRSQTFFPPGMILEDFDDDANVSFFLFLKL